MATHGLVLSGGGARGAYEAGVLYYLFVAAPSELRERVRFQIFSGTSIGALHVTAMAAGLHEPAARARQIADLWRSITVDRVLPLYLRDVLSLSGWLFGQSGKSSLFSGEPIARLLQDIVDWEQLHKNLDDGLLEALTLSCTQVPTGKTVVFYETRDGRERAFSRDPHVRSVYARIGLRHAQASAAIPFVFPPVTIDGVPYVDGGLRQNTPLSPALRLGSDRLLVVGLGHEKRVEDEPEPPEWQRRLSNPVFLLAKVVNAIMLDRVDYDLIRLDHFNRLLTQGEAAFGASFVQRLNSVLSPLREAEYRHVPYLALRPSRDLGELAARYLRAHTVQTRQPLLRRLIMTLARLESRDEADLCSYLLFDGGYCEQLLNLGMEDAQAKREELMRFFE
ncbi:MAG: patatin [Deltaproteobacteria bacterium]|nr:patatin [Deltaproteobacteria bacterium]